MTSHGALPEPGLFLFFTDAVRPRVAGVTMHLHGPILAPREERKKSSFSCDTLARQGGGFPSFAVNKTLLGQYARALLVKKFRLTRSDHC